MMRVPSRGVLTALLALQAGCGGTESPAEPETPVATTVTLSSTTLSFSSLGETQQLTATVVDQNGATMAGASVTWTTSGSSVASVSSTGMVAAVAVGTATITATSGSATGTASVTVVQVAATVTLSPSPLVLAGPGDAVTVTASVMDAEGSEIASPILSWSSDDEGIATVNGVGLVTAVAVGDATVTVEASSGGQTVTGQLSITVVAPNPNLLNGTYTGGSASAVAITWYDTDGTENVNMVWDDVLDTNCSQDWDPQGTLCDEPPTTDDPDVSTKTNQHSGATWYTSVVGPDSGTGVLIVDACNDGACTAITVNAAHIFQMYSDGKATHVRIYFHSELGSTPPAWNDTGWVAQGDFVTIGEGELVVAGSPLAVTAPTVVELAPTVTRYVRFDVQNDNRYGDGSYIELRSVKLY